MALTPLGSRPTHDIRPLTEIAQTLTAYYESIIKDPKISPNPNENMTRDELITWIEDQVEATASIADPATNPHHEEATQDYQHGITILVDNYLSGIRTFKKSINLKKFFKYVEKTGKGVEDTDHSKTLAFGRTIRLAVMAALGGLTVQYGPDLIPGSNNGPSTAEKTGAAAVQANRLEMSLATLEQSLKATPGQWRFAVIKELNTAQSEIDDLQEQAMAHQPDPSPASAADLSQSINQYQTMLNQSGTKLSTALGDLRSKLDPSSSATDSEISQAIADMNLTLQDVKDEISQLDNTQLEALGLKGMAWRILLLIGTLLSMMNLIRREAKIDRNNNLNKAYLNTSKSTRKTP